MGAVTRSFSLAKLLSAITALLVMLLVSVFAVAANNAWQRKIEASRILSALIVKSDMLTSQETLRLEGAILDTALEERDPASPQTLDVIVALHARSHMAFTRLRRHLSNQYASGYSEILGRTAAYDAMMPQIIAAARLPLAQRPDTGAVRSRAANGLLVAMRAKSISLSRSIASGDPFTVEMLRIGDIAWRTRSDAGIDRHGVMSAILAAAPPPLTTLERFAEMKGRVTSSWAAIKDESRQGTFPPALKAAVDRADHIYFTDFLALRSDTIARLTAGQPAAMGGLGWIRLSDLAVASIMAVSNTALELTQAHATAQLALDSRNLYVAIALMLLSIALASFATVYVIWKVIRPLGRITRTMQAIARGELAGEIPFAGRHDEIGQFAQALRLFRDSAVEKRRLQTELMNNQVARETAENSNRIKSEFLANMSHELRTPLNAVIGFSDIMQHQLHGPLPEKYAEYVSLIHESGNHLLNLVSDILDLAKIEAGKFALDMREVNLRETVDYCLRMTRRRAQECGVALDCTMPDGPVALNADPRACKQILLNLLSNAVKFTRKNGVVTLDIRQTGEHIAICVSDTGIGIPADMLARIGTAFEQASNDPMRAREGTGLGLALVKSLVSQHGGVLRIESRENVGTRVTVELPLVQSGRIAA
jgi:signal transduction histidine kinase